MKVLFIGGTGTISTAISKTLLASGQELFLLNRGNRNHRLPPGAVTLTADINDERQVAALIAGMEFDVVADFIAFVPAHLERDYRLFHRKTRQFIFISSASAYQKPPSDYRISEATPLANPFWQYARDKIACEMYLMERYRNEQFPVTIVRPSHTYSEYAVPLGVHGDKGSWQVIKRMLDGKPVIIQGDGTSLWTMTHSRDFARAFTGLMGNLHAIGEAVQIMSDETLTWNQIYTCIAGALGVPLRAVHVASEFLAACSDYDFTGSLLGDKAHSAVFDTAKLKRLVPGFTAAIRFDQGVKETLEYVRSHPECQTPDEPFDAWCDRTIGALERVGGVKS
ncbi:MAG: SDR family oxidoreductase [Prevotellaceae bacterium]|jgi:nucleoside-diphosphate-sugar epimerase|nr:SDR family oxidoreductase [Prevotellaceae bacterium]